MKIIYIAGTSHSGSTLLDLMLNAHPQIVSAGELQNLNRQLQYKNPDKKIYSPCSCGAPSLWECDFWRDVNEQTIEREGKSLDALNVSDYRNVKGQRSANTIVFEAIREVSGKNLIVDSSKSPRRLKHLLQLGEMEIYPVHLLRDPKGQICSVKRKHGGFFKHIFHYEVVHKQLFHRLKSVPHCFVRYEDLVSETELTLNRILEPIGLKFDPKQLLWAEQVKHQAAGNRVRRQRSSDLILDDKWRQNFNVLQKLAIDLGTLQSRRNLARTR
jgi:hypothetical protein